MTALRLTVLTVSVLVALVGLPAQATPLDDYVNMPDPNYGYSYLTKFRGPGLTVHVLNMTSQKWLTEKETDRPIWWHYLNIIVPDQLDYTDTGFLWIDGDSNSKKIPTLEDPFIFLIATLAAGTKMVCATIQQVPNQPIVFKNDPSRKGRSNDNFIAWTWKSYIDDQSNPYIIANLPMTKASVRGMDAMASYSKNISGINMEKFIVGGASKRGWTTWNVAAVDKRVIAMVPTVMDLLNIQKNLHHHYRSLGGWTFAFEDYYNDNTTQNLDSPVSAKMFDIIDPIVYTDRYTMPKLIITSGGDEFFLLDDSHYYYDQMTEPKYLRIFPNAEHTLLPHELTVMADMEAFVISVMEKSPLPNVTWELSQTATGGRIVLRTSQPPVQVKFYHAKTLDDKRRDFRLIALDSQGRETAHPVFWFTREPKMISPTEYVAEMERPETGWVAFFMLVQFPGLKDTTLHFSTQVNIVPDTFPFPDCHGTDCFGTLV